MSNNIITTLPWPSWGPKKEPVVDWQARAKQSEQRIAELEAQNAVLAAALKLMLEDCKQRMVSEHGVGTFMVFGTPSATTYAMAQDALEGSTVALDARLAAERKPIEEQRDDLLTRLGNTEASRDAMRGRINRLSRLDIDDPASYCLNALNEGEISLAKACEWLRKYLLTGAQDPIKQGIMRSGGGDETLREVAQQRDALAAAQAEINSIAATISLLPKEQRTRAEQCLIDSCGRTLEPVEAILSDRLASERKAGKLELIKELRNHAEVFQFHTLLDIYQREIEHGEVKV